MTIEELGALSGLGTKEKLWRRLMALREAKIVNPFLSIANLDATHTLTATGVRDTLTDDVIADSTRALAARTRRPAT